MSRAKPSAEELVLADAMMKALSHLDDGDLDAAFDVLDEFLCGRYGREAVYDGGGGVMRLALSVPRPRSR
jgi:hypothetical protein